MCAIISSFDSGQLISLVDAQQHRGMFKYSVFANNQTHYGKGLFNTKDLFFDGYVVVHLQAPTSTSDCTQPSIIDSSKLWHNGILTTSCINKLSNGSDKFDTSIIHRVLTEQGFSSLSTLEGSFACVYLLNDEYYIFRTKHAQMYIDDKLTISSERFESSKCINFDTVYKLNLKSKSLDEVSKFKTKRFNIIVPGEL